jgi:hypothetical protein
MVKATWSFVLQNAKTLLLEVPNGDKFLPEPNTCSFIHDTTTIKVACLF